MSKSYMGDHDFRRWQRAVLTEYNRLLGEETEGIPAIDLRYRYDLKEKAEEVAQELANRELAERKKKAADDPLA